MRVGSPASTPQRLNSIILQSRTPRRFPPKVPSVHPTKYDFKLFTKSFKRYGGFLEKIRLSEDTMVGRYSFHDIQCEGKRTPIYFCLRAIKPVRTKLSA